MNWVDQCIDGLILVDSDHVVQKFLGTFILCITCTVPDGISREILFCQAFQTTVALFWLPAVGNPKLRTMGFPHEIFTVEDPNLDWRKFYWFVSYYCKLVDLSMHNMNLLRHLNRNFSYFMCSEVHMPSADPCNVTIIPVSHSPQPELLSDIFSS